MLKHFTSPLTSDACGMSNSGSSRRKSVRRKSGNIDNVSIARKAANLVAGTIPSESISPDDANPTLHVSADSLMLGASCSRASGVICLESRTPFRVEERCGLFGSITAPTATGPANAPRPASSIPAILVKPPCQSLCSNERSGSIRIVDSPPCITMDLKDVLNHAHGIAQCIDFAFRTIIPINGNLDDTIAMPSRDKKQFDIERPTHESLTFE